MSHRSFWDTCNIWEVRSSGSLSSGHFLATYRVYLSVPYSYRRFGTTQSFPTNPWDRYVVPKRWYEITTTRCVITQKSAILSYFAAEAWNHASVIPLHWGFSGGGGVVFYFLFLFWFSTQEGIIWTTTFVFVVSVWHSFPFISFPSAWRAVCTPRINYLHEQKDAVQEAVQQHSALPSSQ